MNGRRNIFTVHYHDLKAVYNNSAQLMIAQFTGWRRRRKKHSRNETRSSAIAEGPCDASCQLKSFLLPRNSAETTYTTSPDQIDGMKLEI